MYLAPQNIPSAIVLLFGEKELNFTCFFQQQQQQQQQKKEKKHFILHQPLHTSDLSENLSFCSLSILIAILFEIFTGWLFCPAQ